MNNDRVNGIHHVTAIAGEPQKNLDFYMGLLGLRLVKLTVNFDDPATYHLYYGDQLGHPGTILTFFPWPGAPKGRLGTGQLTAISFSIPEESIGFWSKRLESHGVAFQGPTTRFNDQMLSFSDPEGLHLELVATAGCEEQQCLEGLPRTRGARCERLVWRYSFGEDLGSYGFIVDRNAGLQTARKAGSAFPLHNRI